MPYIAENHKSLTLKSGIFLHRPTTETSVNTVLLTGGPRNGTGPIGPPRLTLANLPSFFPMGNFCLEVRASKQLPKTLSAIQLA